MSARPQASRHQFGVASMATSRTKNTGPFAQYSTISHFNLGTSNPADISPFLIHAKTGVSSHDIASPPASTWAHSSADPQWSQGRDATQPRLKVPAFENGYALLANKAMKPASYKIKNLPVIFSSDPNEKPDIITTKAEFSALKIKKKAVERKFRGAKKSTWYKMAFVPVELSSDSDEEPEAVTFAPALGGHTFLKASMLRAAWLERTLAGSPPEKLFGSMPVEVELAAAKVFSSASALATDDARHYLRPDASCAEVSRPIVTKSTTEKERFEQILQQAHVPKTAKSSVNRTAVQKPGTVVGEKSAAPKRTRHQEDYKEGTDEPPNSAVSRGSAGKRQRLSIEKDAKASRSGVDLEPVDPSQQSQKSRLLSFPPELRNQIYGLVLVDTDRINLSPSTGAVKVPPLLQVCRSIRQEALPVYYGSNDFTTVIHDSNTAYLCRWLNMIGAEGGAKLQRIEIRCSGRFVREGAFGDRDNPSAHYFLALATHLQANSVCRDAIEMRTTFYEEHDVYEVQGTIHQLGSVLYFAKVNADRFHTAVQHYLECRGYKSMPQAPRCRSCRGLKHANTLPLTGNHVRGTVPRTWPRPAPLPSAPAIESSVEVYDDRVYAYPASHQVYKDCIKRTRSADTGESGATADEDIQIVSDCVAGPLSSRFYFDWSPLKKFERWYGGKFKPAASGEDATGRTSTS